MSGEGGPPWYRAPEVPGQREPRQSAPQEWPGDGQYPAAAYQEDWYGQQAYPEAGERSQDRARHPTGTVADSGYPARPDRGADHPTAAVPSPFFPSGEFFPPDDDPGAGPRTPGTGPSEPGLPTGGRAERRKAAKARGRGRRRRAPSAPPPTPRPSETGAPLSRVEARRAARAAKDSPAVIASRAFGELFITIGVLMLLFVTYQLWWTNILAGQQANAAANKIQDEWAKGRAPGAFEPGQGFAIMHIPKLDVVVPIAEGIDKHRVLDRGMVGHYAEGRLKTAMPEDRQGNFAVAGHRNTHGEPFRYINRLTQGDPIVVETQDTYYTYEMRSILPQTAPSNIGVIAPVPAGSGFTGPGRYITLTTCTPEFTSTYRMIVWGKMVDERPRSKGKPDALVG
ncbi:class E sortase [Streptomyces sp. PKU-MA01144]|uniref:class E sortase n=1 Tax=Streptomyces sp. PKU-MA01144 TaxID=2729138 RepID=UPI001480B2D6|nr:class E sortase [Streptomyces sp. PKU-MA01144]NNJ02915.1 class E sortase [Streptomyces sp. PKU-MA01144]